MKSFRYSIIPFLSLVSWQCGNTALLDEAIRYYPRILRSDMSAWWNFDGTLNSRIGGSPGVPTGTYSYTTDRWGRANGALCVDSGFSVSLPSLSLGAEPVTVSFWVRNGVFNAVGNIMVQKSVVTGACMQGYRLSTTATNYYQWEVGDGGGAACTGYFIPTLPEAGQWYHAAMTFSGGKGTYYINKFNNGLANYGSVTGVYANGLADIQLSGSSNGFCYDDFVMYKRSLSNAEISDLFTTEEQ